VWKALRGGMGGVGIGMSSVWDGFFSTDGVALRTPAPVTVNKMRGATSQQPAKIGAHAYELIDHVWYNKGMRLEQHAIEPVRYKSARSARLKLMPDLYIPSDHVPVVVNMAYTPREGDGADAEVAAASWNSEQEVRERLIAPSPGPELDVDVTRDPDGTIGILFDRTLKLTAVGRHAFGCGLHRGDLILAINGITVRTPTELANATANRSKVQITVSTASRIKGPPVPARPGENSPAAIRKLRRFSSDTCRTSRCRTPSPTPVPLPEARSSVWGHAFSGLFGRKHQ